MGFSDQIRKSPTEWPAWGFHPLREETESTHQAIFVGEGIDMISTEVKLCECGCGRPAPIAPYTCSTKGWIKGEPRRFIQWHNWKKSFRKSFSHNGYILIYQPNHPRSDHLGYVREHILIAEGILGKPLPIHVVIHHPYEKSNTKCFIICKNQGYHMLLHQRERALKACGHASWKRCPYCKKYDDLKNMAANGPQFYHRLCHANYEWERRNRPT